MSPFELIVAIIIVLNGINNEDFVRNDCIVQEETVASLNAQGADLYVIHDDCSIIYVD